MGTIWKSLGAAPPRKLVKAHFQPFQLAQWLARFARGYLEAAPDDSHTSLEWRRDLHILATDEARIGGRQLALGLDLRDLTLVTLVDGEIADEALMHGLKDKAAGDWVREQLRAFDIDPKALDAPPPYTIPPSPYVSRRTYDVQKDVVALSELSRYFDNADFLLRGLAEKHRDIKPGPAPVRLWPHHFDMATMITLEVGNFETARAVGAGLAIPDRLHKEFYFYTYPWPRNIRDDLPKLRSKSAYQYDGFFGAVQPLSKVVRARDQGATARTFFDETVDIFIRLLREEMGEARSSGD